METKYTLKAFGKNKIIGKMTKFDYHKEDDIAVFRYGNYDDYERSIEVANFVVDLDGEGRFLGLEVINASRRLPLSKEELDNVRNVETEFFEDDDHKMISICIYYDEHTSQLNVPVANSATGQLA